MYSKLQIMSIQTIPMLDVFVPAERVSWNFIRQVFSDECTHDFVQEYIWRAWEHAGPDGTGTFSIPRTVFLCSRFSRISRSVRILVFRCSLFPANFYSVLFRSRYIVWI